MKTLKYLINCTTKYNDIYNRFFTNKDLTIDIISKYTDSYFENRKIRMNTNPGLAIDSASVSSSIINNGNIYFHSSYEINPSNLIWDYLYMVKITKNLGTIYIDNECFVITPIDNIMRTLYGDEFIYNNDRAKDKNYSYKYKDFIEHSPNELCQTIYNNYYVPILKQNKSADIASYEQIISMFSWEKQQSLDYNELFYNIQEFINCINIMKRDMIATNEKQIYELFNNFIVDVSLNCLDKLPHFNINTKYYFIMEHTINNDIINSLTNIDYSICLISPTESNLDNVDYVVFSNNIEDIKYNAPFNKKSTWLIQHNHNSGLPYVFRPYLNSHKITLAISPYILDYPSKNLISSNIESICNRATYCLHMGFIQEDYKDSSFLILNNSNYLINKDILQTFYIDYIGFKHFIVGSIEQAKQLKELNSDFDILFDATSFSNEDLMNLIKNKDFIYFNQILINSYIDKNIVAKLPTKTIVQINYSEEMLAEICNKYSDLINNFYLVYNKRDSYMPKIENISRLIQQL